MINGCAASAHESFCAYKLNETMGFEISTEINNRYVSPGLHSLTGSPVAIGSQTRSSLGHSEVVPGDFRYALFSSLRRIIDASLIEQPVLMTIDYE